MPAVYKLHYKWILCNVAFQIQESLQMQVQKFAEIILDPNFTPEKKKNNKTIFQNNFLVNWECSI